MHHHFSTTLVSGTRTPYRTWTFLVIPPTLASEWGSGSHPIRGTIAGTPFRGNASRGEGVLRMSVPRELREAAGVATGDTVQVAVELDPEPRLVRIPEELRTVLRKDPEASKLFDALPPAHRRAWASYVAEAKKPETRARRAGKAPKGIREKAFPG